MFKKLFGKRKENPVAKETTETKVEVTPDVSEETFPPRGHNQEIYDKATKMIEFSGKYVNDNMNNITETICNRMKTSNSKGINGPEMYKTLLKGVNREIDRVENYCNMKSSCGKGCAYCCYQAIYVSITEAEFILRAIRNMDIKSIRNIQSQAAYIVQKLENTNIPMRLVDPTKEREINLEFMKLNLRCPLLNENNECMVYETRPIACYAFRNYGNPLDCQGKIAPHTYHFPEFTDTIGLNTMKAIALSYNRWEDTMQNFVLLADFLADNLRYYI